MRDDERLTELVRAGVDRRRHGSWPSLPMLILWAPRGSGLSELLKHVKLREGQNAPSVLLDGEVLGVDRSHEVALRLTWSLGRRLAGFGQITFPRFFLGVTAIRGPLPNGLPDRPDHARVQMIEQVMPNRVGLQSWLAAIAVAGLAGAGKQRAGIGIADGVDSGVFGAGMADVLTMIQDENGRVDASGRGFVAVAYVVPVPKPGVDDRLAASFRRDLVGAYIAQRQANRTKTIGDDPLVRLLVVNHGDSAANWADVVPELVDMADVDSPTFAEHHLVAVAVSGQSRASTEAAIDALLAAEVPVITTRLTADQLTSRPPSADVTMVRVAPTNSEEAAAASTYLRPTAARAMIVQNSDEEDTYSASLGAAFRAAFPDGTHAIVEPTETYSARRAGVANTMKGILRNICQQRPDVVYFAGRAAELAALVAALPFRPCLADVPINIVSGDDVVEFASSIALGPVELRRGLEANATVTYTALAHPAAWTAAPESFAAAPTQFLAGRCPDCLPDVLPDETLDDGSAIIGYDAVVTAVSAVRSPNGINDTPGLVAQAFKRMHGLDSVAGASGWLSFASTGEARNKAVPVLRVRPDGSIEFVQLSSPAGSPCLPYGGSC